MVQRLLHFSCFARALIPFSDKSFSPGPILRKVAAFCTLDSERSFAARDPNVCFREVSTFIPILKVKEQRSHFSLFLRASHSVSADLFELIVHHEIIDMTPAFTELTRIVKVQHACLFKDFCGFSLSLKREQRI